MAPIQHTS